MGKELISNWGINDADYVTSISEELPRVGNKRRRKQIWACPYYMRWSNMIYRCHSELEQSRKPNYKGCVVSEDWRKFSDFRKWILSQEYDESDFQVDKDLLIKGNKVYSPETCVFIDKALNTFLTNSLSTRGEYMLGVYFDKQRGMFKSQINDHITKTRISIGHFHTEIEAHLAWKAKKHEFSCMLSEKYSDPRIKQALMTRYDENSDWTKA